MCATATASISKRLSVMSEETLAEPALTGALCGDSLVSSSSLFGFFLLLVLWFKLLAHTLKVVPATSGDVTSVGV